jgi:hypothetical protein
MFYQKENGGFTRRNGAWYSDLDESKGDGHWEIRAMAKQNRGRVKVLRHGKIKQTRIKEGRWSELCFLFFFFCFFFESSKS